MSLVQSWTTNPEQFNEKRLNQIIAWAGDGQLRDNGAGSAEFRKFLGMVPSKLLEKFVADCLDSPFADSGLALQDVVNEIGRRLEFSVVDGLYQGKKGHMGADGIWTFPKSNHRIVVEVKTTNAYLIDTSRLANYRKQLIDSGECTVQASSILIVVGRDDTNGLECQIRGSRDAWNIRVIGADALLRLMKVREALDDPNTMSQIASILIPREYTRVDSIVALVFSATEEVKQEAPMPEDPVLALPLDASLAGTSAAPAPDHDKSIATFALNKGIVLVKKSRSGWATPDDSIRVVCAVSRVYESAGKKSWWYAFHPNQDEFLSEAKSGFVVLGLAGMNRVLAISHGTLKQWLPLMWTTERKNGEKYWHIRLHEVDQKVSMDRQKPHGRTDVTSYLVGVR